MKPVSSLAPFLLTVSGGLLYHLAAKSVPKSVEPMLVLTVAYATALVVSLATYTLFPAGSAPAAPARPWHPALLLLGLGAVLIELGYVLVYRSAWPVSTASVLTNGVVASLLVPIGILVFGDSLTAWNVVGLVLCLAGLFLLR